jgi:hypothetical protein
LAIFQGINLKFSAFLTGIFLFLQIFCLIFCHLKKNQIFNEKIPFYESFKNGKCGAKVVYIKVENEAKWIKSGKKGPNFLKIVCFFCSSKCLSKKS